MKSSYFEVTSKNLHHWQPSLPDSSGPGSVACDIRIPSLSQVHMQELRDLEL